MSYSTNTPQATDPISSTQGPISTNFSILNTTFASDHIPPTNATSANWGLHQQVTLLAPLASDPSPSGTTSVVYSKTINNYSSGSQEQLFFVNSETGVEQITYPSSLGTSGWTILPGGLLMQWGTSTPSSTGPNSVTFSKTYGTGVYNIQCTFIKASTYNNSLSIGTVTTSGFQYYLNSAPASATVYWMAIGV